jgi:D-glycero-D-manno-heptose 1,7-bisphosphate phosphatase
MGVHALNQRAVFLDRDGVINRAIVRNGRPYPPAHLGELQILPGVDDAMRRLHAAGFLNVVVTNQPDVARGIQTRETVEAMHAHLRRSGLPIDAFYVCYHDGPDSCDCRKPRPGMLLNASSDLLIDLERSFIVGDRWRDIEAGQRAGCTAFLVDYGYAETRPRPPYVAVHSLSSAVQWILNGLMPFAFMPAESYVSPLAQEQRA